MRTSHRGQIPQSSQVRFYDEALGSAIKQLTADLEHTSSFQKTRQLEQTIDALDLLRSDVRGQRLLAIWEGT